MRFLPESGLAGFASLCFAQNDNHFGYLGRMNIVTNCHSKYKYYYNWKKWNHDSVWEIPPFGRDDNAVNERELGAGAAKNQDTWKFSFAAPAPDSTKYILCHPDGATATEGSSVSETFVIGRTELSGIRNLKQLPG